jgi:hypothetical protein
MQTKLMRGHKEDDLFKEPPRFHTSEVVDPGSYLGHTATRQSGWDRVLGGKVC